MKESVFMSGIERCEVGDAVFDRLAEIYPDGVRYDSWFLHLPKNDPRAAAAIAVLDQHGLRPWVDTSRPPDRTREYTFEIRREYEATDLAECEILELWPKSAIGRSLVLADGSLAVDLGRMATGEDIVWADRGCMIATTRAKAAMEQTKLRGVSFTPTGAVHEDASDEKDMPVPWPAGEVKWWEIHSDVTLPPLSPAVRLGGWDGKPAKPDFSTGCIVLDPPYRPALLRYRRSDLPPLERIDVAMTFERCNGHMLPIRGRRTVVGRRFIDACKKARLAVNFIPVRIDPE